MRRRRHPACTNFYSRPCGRGDGRIYPAEKYKYRFLLTPLREGRPGGVVDGYVLASDFYSRPCGRGDGGTPPSLTTPEYFYSRPCGRGDPGILRSEPVLRHFYSRPCGRGDRNKLKFGITTHHFYSRPCGRGDVCGFLLRRSRPCISTHAPAGGATKRTRMSLAFTDDFYSRPCGRGDRRSRSRQDSAL